MKKNALLSSMALLVFLNASVLVSCKKADPNPGKGFLLTGKPKLAPAADGPETQLTASINNGVNLQPSYYNGGNPNFAWALMKAQTRIKTVRIEIEPGYVNQAKNWISQARSNGFAVIASYHKSTVLGSDATSELNAAANWWKANYRNLAASGSFTVNLMNEWGSHNISPAAYAAAYNNAISIVRSVYSGNIIIDIPGYGQETATAACAVKGCSSGQTKINDTRIILSAHIYPGAYNQAKGRYVINSDLDDLASSGRPCMIGEFGNSGGSGANWSGIVDYAKAKGWTVLAWAWNGDGGSMNMVSPSWATNGGASSFTLSSYFNIVYAKL